MNTLAVAAPTLSVALDPALADKVASGDVSVRLIHAHSGESIAGAVDNTTVTFEWPDDVVGVRDFPRLQQLALEVDGLDDAELESAIRAEPEGAEVIEGRGFDGWSWYVEARDGDRVVDRVPVAPFEVTGEILVGRPLARSYHPDFPCLPAYPYGPMSGGKCTPGPIPRACLSQQWPGDMHHVRADVRAGFNGLLLKTKRRRLQWWTRAFEPTHFKEILAHLEGGGLMMRARARELKKAIRRVPRAAHAGDVQRSLHDAWLPSHRAQPDASDAGLIDEMLNGVNPTLFERAGPNRFVSHIHWEGVSFDPNSPYHLPKVTVEIEEDQHGDKWPTRIRWAFPQRGQPLAPLTWHAASPRGGAWSKWSHAKRLVRQCLFVLGQHDYHVARAHLLAEQVFVAMSQTLPCRHPLYTLLRPHVDGAAEINNFGKDLIVEERGILVRATALTNADSVELIQRSLARMDWRTFEPRAPFSSSDHFARQGQAFWAILDGYVKPLVKKALKPKWRAETADFGARMQKHSVEARMPPSRDWVDRRELRQSLPPAGSGHVPSIVAPTTAKEWRQFCRWLIFHTGFVHTWVNDRQIQTGGWLDHAPMGLRSTKHPQGEREYWRDFAPEIPEAALQLLVAEQLARVSHRHFVDDVLNTPYRITRYFEKHRRALLKVGLDLATIRLSPNV